MLRVPRRADVVFRTGNTLGKNANSVLMESQSGISTGIQITARVFRMGIIGTEGETASQFEAPVYHFHRFLRVEDEGNNCERCARSKTISA